MEAIENLCRFRVGKCRQWRVPEREVVYGMV
jgi:hypothetical protein